MDEEIIGRGSFVGASGHTMTGGFMIRQGSKEVLLEISSNFLFDGAPAPWWAFGRKGHFDRDTLFAKLEHETGAQSAIIPATIQIADFDTVILWCRAADVLLGTGAVERV
ncbi:DM13 domain-containing protein [Ensifer aridi]|uniref:DM13 domain-containing protein n=1 Tax=Ensifer aridi TaxID=1708715 RepID=UPI00111BE704|nr:DM13 domain-containing protein [Ensifer aridi]